MLFCLYNITKKKYELLLLSFKGSLKVKLNPNQTHVCCACRDMAKLCSYILYKSISLRTVIKQKHHTRKGVQSFTMEFYQVSEKSDLLHRRQYFLIQLKKIIFVERIYQLRNFGTQFIGCHLSCLQNINCCSYIYKHEWMKMIKPCFLVNFQAAINAAYFWQNALSPPPFIIKIFFSCTTVSLLFSR